VRTIIIGVGNPLLRDDSVGLKIAGRLRDRLRDCPDVAATELYAGGLRLMETMAGHDRAILVDAIQTEGGQPGTIYALEAADVAHTRNICSTHDGSLAAALELGRMAGIGMPDEIRVWAVEAADVGTFSESLTEAVEQAVPRVVEEVMGYLRIGRLPYRERNA